MNNLIRHLRFALIPRGPILDIGSGGAPFWRANVLLDRYLDNDAQRPGTLIHDRPLVCGDIESLPFLDKSFTFVYCAHVLEHVDNPGIAISEIIRISNSGYIETPSELQEFTLLNFPFHKWVVSEENSVLIFREKPENIENHILLEALRGSFAPGDKKIRKHHALFFIKHFWKDRINYKIIRNLNPIKAYNMEHNRTIIGEHSSLNIRKIVKRILSEVYKYRFDYFSLIACPKCKRKPCIEQEKLMCKYCSLAYPVVNNVPIMLLEEAESLK